MRGNGHVSNDLVHFISIPTLQMLVHLINVFRAHKGCKVLSLSESMTRVAARSPLNIKAELPYMDPGVEPSQIAPMCKLICLHSTVVIEARYESGRQRSCQDGREVGRAETRHWTRAS